MSFNFLVPGNFNITQDAQLYVMNLNTLTQSKYHWVISVGTTLNTLFNNRTYTENTTNNTLYNINLTTNTTEIERLLNTNTLNYDTTGSANSTATNLGLETIATFNLRLLEMAALEIFGHAKARAAFSNDISFNNYHTTVSSYMSTSFNSQSIRNNFFEQYVQLNRISGADVGVIATFNLAETSLFVYGNLNGQITDATPTTETSSIFKTSYNTTMRIEFKGRTT
jgi:hypothetical protein